MDLAIGFLLGFFALPFWWILVAFVTFIVGVICCEHDEFAWSTLTTVVGAGLVTWLGADVNPFVWLWQNLADVARFLLFYFAIGGLWSIVKWYLYLLKVRDKAREDFERFKAAGREKDSHPKRPSTSYARENKARLVGWIAHWPFSMVGSVFGDFLTRIVKSIYNVLSDLYDRMANHVFKDFDPER
jgi:hypothetical protein